MVDPTQPSLFRHRPAKMLADESYASPRLTPKSNVLKEIEARQQEVAGVKLPDTVKILHASQR